jgi:hypothetical protein
VRGAGELLMRGTVLTDKSFPVQAVQVSDDSGQVGIVTFRDGKAHICVRDGGRSASMPEERPEMLEAARQALRDRDTAFMRVMMSRIREAVSAAAGLSACTAPVLSPGGRKLSFRFVHSAIGCDPEGYEVIIRRKRPDPGQEGQG